MSSIFRLKVQHIEQICLFELSWGQGQQLSATLKYPTSLTERYQDWRQIYLSFYQTAEMPLSLENSFITEPWRGRAVAGGQLIPSPDWHSKLVEAEAKLLNEFHRWLRSADLFEIRATIARSSRELAAARSPLHQSIDVFLTCTPIELARLPWEVWEIGSDVAATGMIRMVRAPATIRGTVIPSSPQITQRSRGRARILVILGDATGLNFQVDQKAIGSLARIAEVTFVGWQPGQTATAVKDQIQQAIANPRGWDILFFAGHSNETESTGGELAIAPGASITIREIEAQLRAAKERGLQVAIFNSCSGLNIAEALIDLGFSQVAVMREPIHNRVAQEFLVQFLRGLADHKDVHESLLSACQFLRLEKNLTYPSAYLLPSLFCYPGATLYRILPLQWTRFLRQLVPTRWEALALIAGITLSLIPAVQMALLDARILLQAAYRDYTNQIPSMAEPPPVAIVQIDTASISQAGISQIQPLDRRYLARLIDRLTQLEARLIGIDFVLDTPQPGDEELSESIQTAIDQNHTWFVFAAILDANGEIGVNPITGITNSKESLEGYINATPHSVMLPYPNEDCRQTCPFAYLLSLVHTAQRYPVNHLPQPQSHRGHDLRVQFLDAISNSSSSHPLTSLQQLHLSAISVWAYEQWSLNWLEPIIDFSIPADRIYDRIPAWQLLDTDQPISTHLSQQIILIAPGADERTGMAPGKADRFPVPAAMRYWRVQNWLTGGESLAYMMHHQLTQRLVIPIPNLWIVAGVALLGKGGSLWLTHQKQQLIQQRQKKYLAGLIAVTAAYGLIGLQLYISAAVLCPWLLPSAVLWAYILPALRRSTDA